MSTDILDVIDGALRDYDTSGDAMRWAPPGSTPEPPPSARSGRFGLVREARTCHTVSFEAAMRQLLTAIGVTIPSLARLAESVAALGAGYDWPRSAGLSAMHRAYHQRRKARLRRKNR